MHTLKMQTKMNTDEKIKDFMISFISYSLCYICLWNIDLSPVLR